MKTNAITTRVAIKGVVYYNDDEIKNKIDNMIYTIERYRNEMLNANNDEIVKECIQKSADIINTSCEDVEFMYNTADTISALVGYQDDNYNRNMIIPKDYISDELIEALTPIDLGNNIINNYLKKAKAVGTSGKNEIVNEEPIDEVLCIAVPSVNGKPDFNNICKFSINKDGNINRLE